MKYLEHNECLSFPNLTNYKDDLFFLVVLLTPLSMSLSDLGMVGFNVEMAFPTEPILFGLMLLTLCKIFYDFTSLL